MPWKESARTAAVPLRRRYRCDDCQHEFQVFLKEMDDPAPDCPMCPPPVDFGSAGPKSPVVWVPPLVGKRTSISVAVEMTYKMHEASGATNMRDNQRPGDTAFMPPTPMQTAEKEQMTRDLVQAHVPVETAVQISEGAKNFWQGTSGEAAATLGNMDVARAASAQQVAAGIDPIGMLEKARETGTMRPQYDVVASGSLTDK